MDKKSKKEKKLLKAERKDQELHEQQRVASHVRVGRGEGHGAWWHTARPNRSDKPRSCLLGMYCRPCVITQEDMQAQLDLLDNPDETVTQLMCGNIYKPRIIGAEKLKDTRP